MNSINSYNAQLIKFLLLIYLMFLTFKYLVSYGPIRVPQIIFSLAFLIIFLFSVSILKRVKLIIWELLIVAFIMIFISILNESILSYHFYYLLFIFFSQFALFNILYTYKIHPIQISKLISLGILFHIFISPLTITKTWYGGYQIKSFSDYNTFFALQISTILPFYLYFKNKSIRYFLILIVFIVLILAGSRGAIIAIAFAFWTTSNHKLRNLFFILISLIGLLAFLYIFFPSSIKYLLMKIPFISNYFGLKYNDVSDYTRYLAIVNTISYAPSVTNIILGNGILFNRVHFQVHNILLEIYSDYGILTATVFLILFINMFLKLRKLSKIFIDATHIYTSFLIFIVNYMFEPNYIHFFFWFFIFYYSYTITFYRNIKRGNYANFNNYSNV